MLKRLKDILLGTKPSEEEAPESIMTSLEFDKTGEVTDNDLRIATAVLLVHVASSDEEITREEAEAICAVIERNLGIDEDSIPGLIQVAVKARRENQKIDDFITLINEKFSVDQRILLLAMVWKVILADQKIEKLEDRMAVQLMNRLRLTVADGENARSMAERDEV